MERVTRAGCASAKSIERTVFGPRSQQLLDLSLGQTGLSLGVLDHHQDGPTECSRFTFDRRWLSNRRCFSPSPDLRLHAKDQWTNPSSVPVSPFFAALSDTQPDGFARSILDQALGETGILDHPLSVLESRELRSLCAVHDLCRLGALRVRPRTERLVVSGDAIQLPLAGDLDAMVEACKGFEQGQADQHQLQLLLNCATALGGSRPKISFVQDNGGVAVARLPRAEDEHPVVRIEMLFNVLAKAAGLRVAEARMMPLRCGPVLITQRFDRGEGGQRSPYLSARSLLQLQDNEAVNVRELLEAMRANCRCFSEDGPQLWRRLVFMRLVNATSHALCKIGFIYGDRGRWRLAPACGIRPRLGTRNSAQEFPSSCRGVAWNLETLLSRSEMFAVSSIEAHDALARMVQVVGRWKEQATAFAVGMKSGEIEQLEVVMNNESLQRARELLVHCNGSRKLLESVHRVHSNLNA